MLGWAEMQKTTCTIDEWSQDENYDHIISLLGNWLA